MDKNAVIGVVGVVTGTLIGVTGLGVGVGVAHDQAFTSDRSSCVDALVAARGGVQPLVAQYSRPVPQKLQVRPADWTAVRNGADSVQARCLTEDLIPRNNDLREDFAGSSEAADVSWTFAHLPARDGGSGTVASDLLDDWYGFCARALEYVLALDEPGVWPF